MFGKKSKLSESQKFIVAKGREIGNLKAAGPRFNKKQALATNGGGETGRKQGKDPFDRQDGAQKSLGRGGKFGS